MKKEELKEKVMQTKTFKKAVRMILDSTLKLPFPPEDLPDVLGDYIVGIKNEKLQRPLL